MGSFLTLWIKISSIYLSMSSLNFKKNARIHASTKPITSLSLSISTNHKFRHDDECIHSEAISSSLASSSSIVSCWDNCFDNVTLSSIYTAGKARSHGFTTVFDRHDESSPRSPLESAIVSLLEQMEQQQQQNDSDELVKVQSSSPSNQNNNNKHRYVEYWWRESDTSSSLPNKKPRMLEVHRDIDEELCRKVQYPLTLGSSQKIGQQRCPTFGHVLYVNIDLPQPKYQAPTLIWEESESSFCTVNGEKDTTPVHIGGGGGGGPPRFPLSKVWVVPAVTNRLLRFRGDCLHAVCYPPLQFLKTIKESSSSLSPSLQEDHENSSSSRNDNHYQQEQHHHRRAVLLFNTWEDPPLYPPVGEALCKSETAAAEQQQQKQQQHTKNYFQFPQQPKGQNEKENVPLQSSVSSNLVKLSVPLLGDIHRRGCPETHLESLIDRQMAVQALTSTKDVYCLPIINTSQNN